MPVALDVRVERLPGELEAAVYFVCAEGLANVAKYASASRARLEVAARDGRVTVVVADDGIGGADTTRGTGLQGLADRVEALGGTLGVASPAGGGTRLAAEIPLGGEALLTAATWRRRSAASRWPSRRARAGARRARPAAR